MPLSCGQGGIRSLQALSELAALDQETPASSAGARDAGSSRVSALRSRTRYAAPCLCPAAPPPPSNGASRPASACRQLDEARLQHVLEAHPYTSFPIDRIEAAVASIPAAQFPACQRHLLSCGASHVFW